jgi:putative oxidoreductase
MKGRDDLVRRSLELRSSPAIKDGALLAARVGLAWLFIYHGASTLFGAFHGAGIHNTAVFFANDAHLHPGTFFAVLNGITEFFGGIAIGVGLLSRLAAIGLFGDMVIAMITVTFHNGIVSNAAGSGYEINVALAALAAVIVLLGAGRLSLDAWLGRLVARRMSARPASLASTLP